MTRARASRRAQQFSAVSVDQVSDIDTVSVVPHLRTVVYTAILGGSDSLHPAPAGADRCVCFVEHAADYPDAMGWTLLEHRYAGDARRAAWALRSIPPEALGEYDQLVWIDASFTLLDLPRLLKDSEGAEIAAQRHKSRNSYVKEGQRLVEIGQSQDAAVARQITTYLSAGFHPKHLSVSSMVVRTNSEKVRAFNQTWDREINTHIGDNTQVSFDYSAWVNGLTIKALAGNRHVNPYATHDRRDHETRRRPYQYSVKR